MALNDANEEICLLPGKANRHGLIAGATGTGKTVTLRVMAEAFSEMGVPVFLADVKGDLAGMMAPGIDSEDMQARIERFNLKENGFSYQGYPVTFWDIYGQNGIQLGRLQGGRHGSHLTVEECLGLGHQTSQRLGIALGHKADGAVDNLKVFLTQRLVLLPLGLGGGEGIGLVQVGQYLDSILLGTEVGKYPVEVFLHVE